MRILQDASYLPVTIYREHYFVKEKAILGRRIPKNMI